MHSKCTMENFLLEIAQFAHQMTCFQLMAMSDVFVDIFRCWIDFSFSFSTAVKKSLGA